MSDPELPVLESTGYTIVEVTSPTVGLWDFGETIIPPSITTISSFGFSEPEELPRPNELDSQSDVSLAGLNQVEDNETAFCPSL